MKHLLFACELFIASMTAHASNDAVYNVKMNHFKNFSGTFDMNEYAIDTLQIINAEFSSVVAGKQYNEYEKMIFLLVICKRYNYKNTFIQEFYDKVFENNNIRNVSYEEKITILEQFSDELFKNGIAVYLNSYVQPLIQILENRKEREDDPTIQQLIGALHPNRDNTFEYYVAKLDLQEHGPAMVLKSHSGKNIFLVDQSAKNSPNRRVIRCNELIHLYSPLTVKQLYEKTTMFSMIIVSHLQIEEVLSTLASNQIDPNQGILQGLHSLYEPSKSLQMFADTDVKLSTLLHGESQHFLIGVFTGMHLEIIFAKKGKNFWKIYFEHTKGKQNLRDSDFGRIWGEIDDNDIQQFKELQLQQYKDLSKRFRK